MSSRSRACPWWGRREPQLDPLSGLESAQHYEWSDGVFIVRGAEASYWATRIIRPTTEAEHQAVEPLLWYLLADPLDPEVKPKLADGSDLPESTRAGLLAAVWQALNADRVPEPLLRMAASLST